MKTMKTHIAIAMIALGAAAASAEEPSLTVLNGQASYGGFMPQCVSANGRYLCGSTYIWAGFVSDWQEQNSKVYLEEDGSSFIDYGCDLPFITNEGVAIGFDDSGVIKIDFPNSSVEHVAISGIVDSMSQDGTIMVGMTRVNQESDFGDPHVIGYQACYWENGRLTLLPVPTEEELGYYYLRTRARCISGDGSVIMGEVTDRLALSPMILWYRQDDGSYKLDAVCEKYFSDIKYNDGSYKEYVMFRGDALSDNGEWVAMSLRDAPAYGEPADASQELALYNVKTGKLTKARPDYTELGFFDNAKFEVYYNAVSDNGTVVGYYLNDFGGESAFIMHADDMEPRNFINVFDSVGTLVDYEEEGINRPSAISADGRYITGFGWMGNFYEGYVLDTGKSETSGVGAPAALAPEGGAPAYYSVTGQRIYGTPKGICIRVNNGKADKIIM